MRTYTLVTMAATAAVAGFFGVAGPSAAPRAVMCDGKAATIVVTAAYPAAVHGTGGADVIAPAAGVSPVEIFGEGGDDTICGSSDASAGDILIGNHGKDSIFGLAGPDCIIGDNAGVFPDSCQADFLEVTGGADHLEGGGGDDEIHGQIGGDTELGGPGNDVMDGDDGGDTLKGQNGDDIVRGESGKDALFGGAGNDSLDGGNGSDTCAGGSGSDTFVSC